MGRRSIALEDTVKVRNAAAVQLRTLLKRYDLAEFQAQTHAAGMVDILAGFAMDINQPVDFRRQCANDVLDRGYGKPASKAKVEIVDTTAAGITGKAIGDEIEAAIISAEVFQRLSELTMKQIPYDQWPDDVRKAAEGMDAFFTEEK